MAGINSNNVFVKNLEWVGDLRASQHMTTVESLFNDVVDVSKLNLKVDHPNVSTTMIEKIRNMSLFGSLSLRVLFVVPDFNVNL